MRQISLALERDSNCVTLLWLSQTTLDWILDWRLSRFRRARFNWYPSFVSHHIRATFTIVYIVLHREHRTVWNFFCILEARGRFQNLLWYLGRSLGEDKWPFGRHHSNSLRCHHRHIRHHHHPGHHHHQVLQLVAQHYFFLADNKIPERIENMLFCIFQGQNLPNKVVFNHIPMKADYRNMCMCMCMLILLLWTISPLLRSGSCTINHNSAKRSGML